jgi:hypothetical protein
LDNKAITYVGLDVHQETTALAEAGGRGDVREYGKIANTPAAVKAAARRAFSKPILTKRPF